MFKKHTSPNFNERRGGQNPSMLILHYTGMENAAAVFERLCDPATEVSAHYVVEENGKIHHLVPDDKRAWHAGVSHWKGESDINSASIGIEIVNPGFDFGYRTFPDKQIGAVVKLCKKLMIEHGISPANIQGHSDIAVTRKIDPGHLFPWEHLAREGVGLWPAPKEMDYQAAEDLIVNPDDLHELFGAFGYDSSKPLEELVVAFHRRYTPEKFTAETDTPSELDVATCAKLLSLIRQVHEVS